MTQQKRLVYIFVFLKSKAYKNSTSFLDSSPSRSRDGKERTLGMMSNNNGVVAGTKERKEKEAN